MGKQRWPVGSSVAPTSQHATSLLGRIKSVVRGVFHTVDLILGIALLFVLLPPILVAMQIHRIKQWSEDYEDS
jgi:hypothetical protein